MRGSPHSENLRKLLISSGRAYKIPKGQVLQSSDDRILYNLVITGFVKRYLITNDGTLGVQSIFGPGYTFPLTPVFKTLLDQSLYSGPEIYYYQSMTDIEIYSIDQKTLKEKVSANPSLFKDLFSEAGIRLQDNIQRLENLALKSSYKRLAHQILYFALQFGERTSTGIRIDMPLTHQDFADSLSLTRETISACMMDLRKKGLIKVAKFITVPNVKKLEKEAYS
jgi:CRP-like cAMP-binding protein